MRASSPFAGERRLQDGAESRRRAGRALICLRYGIGDLVMELPALQALRGFLPGVRLTALGARPAIELLENEGGVDDLASVQDFGFSHWGDPGTPESRKFFREWLRSHQFELILDPSHAVLGARDLIWRHHRGRFLDAGSENQDQALAQGQGGVAAIKSAVSAGWGLKIPAGALPFLRLSGKEHASAERLLNRMGLGAGVLFGFSPVASSHLKRWPVERLASVADRLLAGGFEAALLFCGPQRQIARKLLASMQHRRRVAVIADLHLRQVAALLGRCRLFICNDTGLLHLAAAMQVPVLGIFGPTSPAIYLPPANAWAAAVMDNCPHRKLTSFGPPACLVGDRCLTHPRGCLERIEVERLLVLLQIPALSLERPGATG